MEMLPRGGMSTVYKARQVSLDRLVAIKVLPSASEGVGADEVEQFMSEAKITAGLKHQNIVQVYDFGRTDEGVYYFVMEYVSGYTVAAWIRRKNYLSEENTLLCGFSVAMAMNYAWQKAGIVHCDIKPDNIIIDGDGTVKVADLGLARSVRAISGRTGAEEKTVLGTPNYISPEQSRGDEPLDCRADIYSLGAMFYHCMTGVMPFEGAPAMEVMDRQITDQIRAPQDVNPRISAWSACLIEKMMAKERKYRQQDWAETIRDISNARSEMMPQLALAPTAVSTVKRSAIPRESMRNAGSPPTEPVKVRAVVAPPVLKRLLPVLMRKMLFVLPALAAVLAAVWIVYDFFIDNRTVEIENRHELPLRPLETLRQTTFKTEESAKPPGKYEMILRESEKLMEQLDGKAQVAASRGRFIDAAEVYEKYSGLYAAETSAARAKKALFFRKKHDNSLDKRQEQEKLVKLQLKHVADETAEIIMADDISAAWERLAITAADLPEAAGKNEFKNLVAMLARARSPDRKILDSFRSQKNKNISIAFASGTTNLFIRDVREGIVLAEKVTMTEWGTIGVRKNFRTRDLTLDEKMSRLGGKGGPATALMAVSLALDAWDCNSALAYASKTGSLLSGPLTEAVRRESERRAALALALVARRAGISDQDSAPPPEVCLQSLHGRKFFTQKSAELGRNVGQFRARFGFTETARNYDAVLQSLTNAYFRQSESCPPQATQAKTFAPVEPPIAGGELVSRVTVKMLELNSGLRINEMTFRPDSAGQIESAEIVSACLRDIKPVGNLTTLQRLVCSGMRQNIRLDTPLIAPLDDLSPLKSINLTGLAANNTRVKDISSLGHMSLVDLDLAHTRVSDLLPLAGKQLKNLDISFTSVRDIKILAGMPLDCLNISGTDVSDLGPLNGAPLAMLYAGFTRIRDLSVLSAMRLRYLSIRNTPVSDISGLQQMPLEFLNISGTRVRDLSPLAGLPLQRLEMSDCDISDLSALRGMELHHLDLHNTRVRDLSALAGMPLEFLNVSRTGIRDISTLQNMPLKMLFLRETEVRDLTPLENSGIEELWLDDFQDQIDGEKKRGILAALYKMPKLKNVNGRPLWMQQKDE